MSKECIKGGSLRKYIRRRGYNDRLYFFNLQFAQCFTIACFILTALSGVLNITDMSIVNYGIPAVWGEVSLHTALIIWKAKAENKLKFNKEIELFDLNEEE